MQEIEFLGHLVSDVIKDKNEAFERYPRPTNRKSLQRWIGLCNWQQRFICNLSRLFEPLYKLLKK